MHTTILSTATLAANLAAEWVILDCRSDLHNENWGRDEYARAHVPGAMHADLGRDMSARPDGTNGRHPLPSIEQMAATFGRFGVDRGRQVVLYDQDSGMYASRLWWMLRYMGHDAAAVLDGGWAKWTRESLPTRSGVEQRAAVSFTPAPRPEMLADLDHMRRSVGNPAVRLVDARAPERFEGRSETLDRVAGHIPGAANRFFKRNLADDGTMLPGDTLRTQFADALAGASPDHAIMYCGSGVTACQNLLAMEVAGLPGARLYVGSWSEWSSDPERAIETGPAR
jgi:thiosulfate/3-mercaptopyruvate sulfurtransferase